MNLFVSNVFAQASTQNANQPNPIISFLPFILIFVIFYFLMIRPQKKKMQEESSMINALSKGDEIYTKSGIIGTIYGLTDKIVTLEVSEGVKLKVLKNQIGGSAKKLFEKKEETKK
ncbi:MAG: preprotein translocase subunit YajC [Bdellovibrionales bacterium RIFOXYB1_FULL_37_110]|nr:MAG: preprotein translocase subunit YajC [Bdellovibrionales bacterium RIFOXYC1_FULL_37_79]OFZ59345.1 MAG: preprotein translocase subunit YajC [Bdellovibrionales bacterium RIFOXYB1_FULL_37_110]OFZ61905.1 MAG: preprotein translocase subunit YajC [Bdellovibrionales bacterium RIFOXYD1_FULL_36_51]OFZ67482.1 MAG: preprotein translocase subunit YajC [Bdellovibrionales bacterium RIFOXYB2_FULL_36_6]